MEPHPNCLQERTTWSQDSIQLGFLLTNNFTSAETELKDEDVNFDSLWQQWPWANGEAGEQQQPLQTNQQTDLQASHIPTSYAAHNNAAMMPNQAIATLPVVPSQPIQMPQMPPFQVNIDDQSSGLLPQAGHINWRKYGEKILKGKESQGRVRAYFKCTHPDCEVRKHVEKSINSDGADQVTITGVHNHNLQPATRTRVMKADTSHLDSGMVVAERPAKRTKLENVSVPLDTRVLGLVMQNQNNFAVSDPHIADCPIIFASNGFCQLTGYELSETLGRNCRYLQGEDTNRATVNQISQAVKNCEEIHVILLNYCKNGTPFWNLLHLSPVLDADQRLVSFVGSQINVSAAVGAQQQQMPLPPEGATAFIRGSTSGNELVTAEMSTPLQMSQQTSIPLQMSQQMSTTHQMSQHTSTNQQRAGQRMSQNQQVEMANQQYCISPTQ